MTPDNPTPQDPLSNIERHMNGERVTTRYIDTVTGKEITVPLDEPVPDGADREGQQGSALV